MMNSNYRIWEPLDGKPLDGTFGATRLDLQKLFFQIVHRDLESKDKWLVRLAPSLSTRGEADLLGVSDPRFCQRVLMLDGNRCVGLVNVRRMRRLLDQLNELKIRRYIPDPLRAKPIAECLLAVPDSLGEDEWQILKVPDDLALNLGEGLHSPIHETIKAGGRLMPYFMHLHILGGGMCAQACCYMASLLLYDRAKSIYSSPEISHISVNHQSGPLRLSGLNTAGILQYFSSERVGMNAVEQFSDWHGVGQPMAQQYLPFYEAIRAYINAGCPLICPVDSGRMLGRAYSAETKEHQEERRRKPPEECCPEPKNVLRENNLSRTVAAAHYPNPKDQRHAVLVVGYHKHREQLLVMDPATYPFLKMHPADLLLNACYAVPKRRQFVYGDRLCPGSIIPITPAAVRLPLLDYNAAEPAGHSHKRRGLMHIAATLPSQTPVNSYCGQYEVPEFCLAQLERVASPQELRRLVKALDEPLMELIHAETETWQQAGLPGDTWLWIMRSHDGVFFWNAGQPAETWDDALENWQDFLLFGVELVGGKAFVLRGNLPSRKAKARSEPGDRPPSPVPEGEGVDLVAGFVSSFSSPGLERSLRADIDESTPVDVYAFMHVDGRSLLKDRLGRMSAARGQDAVPWLVRTWSNAQLSTHSAWKSFPALQRSLPHVVLRRGAFERFQFPEVSVCSWLSHHSRGRGFARRVAERLAKLLGARPCPCFATFLPELGSPDKDVQDMAVRAMTCIVKVAEALGHLRNGNGVQTIEVVAGSVIGHRQVGQHREVITDALGVEIDLGTDYLEARIDDRLAVFERILEGLKEVIRRTQTKLQFAFELEPGILFALSAWKDMKKFLSVLERTQFATVSEQVGFNCDFGHWRLAGITAEQIRHDLHAPQASVARRIIHSHASCHGKAHLSDLPPSSPADDTFLQEFARAVGLAYRNPHPSLKPTNIVAFELEMPVAEEDMKFSVRRLRGLLRKSPSLA